MHTARYQCQLSLNSSSPPLSPSPHSLLLRSLYQDSSSLGPLYLKPSLSTQPVTHSHRDSSDAHFSFQVCDNTITSHVCTWITNTITSHVCIYMDHYSCMTLSVHGWSDIFRMHFINMWHYMYFLLVTCYIMYYNSDGSVWLGSFSRKWGKLSWDVWRQRYHVAHTMHTKSLCISDTLETMPGLISSYWSSSWLPAVSGVQSLACSVNTFGAFSHHNSYHQYSYIIVTINTVTTIL